MDDLFFIISLNNSAAFLYQTLQTNTYNSTLIIERSFRYDGQNVECRCKELTRQTFSPVGSFKTSGILFTQQGKLKRQEMLPPVSNQIIEGN